jgi:hypothetical protein
MKTAISIFIIVTSCLILTSCENTPVDPGNQSVQVFFMYNFENELNTFDNTYQKDLDADGAIKISFNLTAEEHERIVQKASEINFFSFPDTLPKYNNTDSIVAHVEPNCNEVLRIKTQTEDHISVWNSDIFYNQTEYLRIQELRSIIISIIESKQQYQSLPAAKGGYL